MGVGCHTQFHAAMLLCLLCYAMLETTCTYSVQVHTADGQNPLLIGGDACTGQITMLKATPEHAP